MAARPPWHTPSRPACLVALLALLALLAVPAAARAGPGDVHLALGNPSDARDDRARPDPVNFLIVKDQFALSYNSKKGTPNWVSYRLRRADMGRAPRPMMEFHPDPDLPRAFYAVRPFDYQFSRTAFSRGHLCPNGHRNDTTENARATFVMTNMVPQTEELNDGAWKDLEIYCANLASREGKELYIVCGPHGVGGTSVRGQFKTIGDGRVTVPRSCWKVVLVLDNSAAKDPVQRVSAKSRLLAVVMPNDRTPENKRWQDYKVGMADVEALTGYRFFDRVPAPILDALRKQSER